IPRADADENAAAAIAQLVRFAGRAGQRFRSKRAARLDGVIAAEIDRLTHLRDGVIERLAAFRLQQRDEPSAPRLQEIAGTFQRGRARAEGPRPPAGEAALRPPPRA